MKKAIPQFINLLAIGIGSMLIGSYFNSSELGFGIGLLVWALLPDVT